MITEHTNQIVETALKPKKILLIDDDANDRALFRMFLKDHNCVLDEAQTGDDGLAKIVSNRYHIIFLDLRMPGEPGIETFKKIKLIQSSTNVRQRVVILSGAYTMSVLDEFHKIGFVSFIHKPQCFSQEFMNDLLDMFGIDKTAK